MRDNPQTVRARLQGEALKKWYAKDVRNLTPEQWEAEHKRLSEARAGLFEMYAWGSVLVLGIVNFLFPIFSPVMIGVFGIWLVIGSGNLWFRVAATVGMTLVLGITSSDLMAFLLIVLFLTTCGAYVAALVASYVSRMPTRLSQFSLWDIGGCTLALAAGLAMLRGSGFDIERFEDSKHSALFFGSAVAVALNVLVASSPMLVPRRYRSSLWFWGTALLTLVILPALEYEICDTHRMHFRFWFDDAYDFSVYHNNADIVFQHFFFLIGIDPGNLDTGPTIVKLHAIGTGIVWLLVYTMEGALAFRDVDVATLKTPMQDPLD